MILPEKQCRSESPVFPHQDPGLPDCFGFEGTDLPCQWNCLVLLAHQIHTRRIPESRMLRRHSPSVSRLTPKLLHPSRRTLLVHVVEERTFWVNAVHLSCFTLLQTILPLHILV